MRSIALGLLGFLLPLAVQADPVFSSPGFGDNHICMWHGNTPRLRGVSEYQEAHPDALKAVEWITGLVGLEPNFEVLSAKFANGGGAFATIYKGQRYIVFDRAFTSWGDGKTDWHAIGVAAHEVGHHLASHVFTDETDKHAEELEADAFAGFAMGYLGATLEQALTLFPGDRPASPSHPADSDRRVAITDGWRRGSSRRSVPARSCKPAWVSDRLYVDSLPCRLAQICESGAARVRLSCRDASGAWIWQD